MNKELLQIMENTRKNYSEMHEGLVKAYNEAVLEGSSKEAVISFAKSANSVRERYIEVNDNIKKYLAIVSSQGINNYYIILNKLIRPDDYKSIK